MSITIYLLGDIDGVVDGALAIDDRVVAVHAIPHYHGVHTLVCGVGDRVAVYGVKARIKASAAQEEKAHHTEDKHQVH